MRSRCRASHSGQPAHQTPAVLGTVHAATVAVDLPGSTGRPRVRALQPRQRSGEIITMANGIVLIKGTTVRLLDGGELGTVEEDPGKGAVHVKTSSGVLVVVARQALLTYREFNDA